MGRLLRLLAASVGGVHSAAKSTALWLLLAVLASESHICSAWLPSWLGLQTRTQHCPIGQETWTGDRFAISPDFFQSGRDAAADLFGNSSCGTAARGPRKCMDSKPAVAGPSGQQPEGIRDEAKGAAAATQTSGDNNRERAVPETKHQANPTEAAAAENRQGISCKDHNGEDVDWFFAIKLSQSRRLIYVASNGANGGWIQVDDVCNASPVSNTYQQEQNPVTTRSRLFLYNDHPPGKEAETSGAHMKGVILHGSGNEDTGFWMLHSVPQFSDVEWSNIDGQSFFCVTLNRLEIEIVKNLVRDLSTPFRHTFHYRDDERSEYQTLQTRNGANLHINGKNNSNEADIYNQIRVDDDNLTKVRVQTNRLGASPPLPSDDRLNNVAATKFLQDPVFGMLFSQDNSKWSIGEIPVEKWESRKFFCAGDLDRVEAHKTRGGCLVCMENQRLWGLLYDAIQRGVELNNQGHQPPHDLPTTGTCKITENQPVDWFIVVKDRGKHAYRYLSSLDDLNWQFHNGTMNSPLDWTLREANAAANKTFYNDQHDRVRTNAHAKGVFVEGDPSGFWLMHSMPHFPVLNVTSSIPRKWAVVEHDFWPKGKKGDNVQNAQIFLCLTFNAEAENKNNIKRQIQVMENNKSVEFHSTRLVSFGGVEFVHISKSPSPSPSPSPSEDVYETVSKLIGDRLYVQSFYGGGGDLGSTQRITQIRKTQFDNNWKPILAGSDHSKWCVAQNKNVPYFCIGDLNRKESQKKRGGGVLCLWNRNVYRKFDEAITDIDEL